MQAVEFEAEIKNGQLTIPVELLAQLQQVASTQQSRIGDLRSSDLLHLLIFKSTSTISNLKITIRQLTVFFYVKK